MSRTEIPMGRSYAVQENIVLPGDTNMHNTMFGGLLMKHIDETAAISARRHCKCPVVTASNDGVHFHRPIQNDDIVRLESFVCSAGRTSMEVFIKISTEHSSTGDIELAAISYLTFVALGENGKPCEVPLPVPQTEEEILVHRDRETRKEMRLKKRSETNTLINSLTTRQT